MASPKSKAPKSQVPLPGKIVAAIVADAHVGNHMRNGGPIEAGLNRRGRESAGVLRCAVEMARAAGAPRFIVAGDLFHSRRPEPAVIRAVQEALDGDDEMERALVPGNHDMLDATAAEGNTAMAPLYEVVDIIADRPCWSGPILLAPFWGLAPMAEFIGALLEEKAKDLGRSSTRFLVTHVGLYDEKGAAPWQRRARDGMSGTALLDAMVANDFRTAVVGNYHEHRWWARGIGKKADGLQATAIQAGTLCPASHGDGGLENRGLMIYLREDGSWEKVEVPGPRFLTVPRGGEAPPAAPPGFSYYVRSAGSMKGDGGAAVDAGWAALEEYGVPETDEGIDQARVEEETDEEAIAATVAEAELPEGIGRAAVEALALEMWRRA